MSPRSLVLAAALLTAAPAAALHAQTPAAPMAAKTADYSGSWELDVAKSNFGGQPAPGRIVMRVRHAGTALQIVTEATTPMGDQRDSTGYTIGGPATPHDIPNIGPSMTSAAIDAGQLVTKAVIQTQGIEVPVNSRWALAPDGKTLTVDRTITTPMGEMAMQLVFNRK
jgi:hypothetical protein